MAQGPINEAPYRLLEDVTLEDKVVVLLFTNLYGFEVGANTRIGPLVEIQKRVRIGANCKIQSHAFICTGVEIEDEVFVGGCLHQRQVLARDRRGQAAGRGQLGALADHGGAWSEARLGGSGRGWSPQRPMARRKREVGYGEASVSGRGSASMAMNSLR
jgi:transferase family hexapeptide repeat protein